MCISYLNVPKHPQYWEFQIFFLSMNWQTCLPQCWGTKGRLRLELWHRQGAEISSTWTSCRGDFFLGASYCILQIQVECLCQVPLVWIILIFPHFPTFSHTKVAISAGVYGASFRHSHRSQLVPSQPDPQWHCWPPSTVSASHARNQGPRMLMGYPWIRIWIRINNHGI